MKEIISPHGQAGGLDRRQYTWVRIWASPTRGWIPSPGSKVTRHNSSLYIQSYILV